MTLDDLIAYGADVETGLQRCMGSEAIYLKLVETVKEEASFGRLEQALDAGDLDAAFDAAHALKGVLGNLALTPLYDPVHEITELLRSRTEMDYTEQYGKINDAWQALRLL